MSVSRFCPPLGKGDFIPAPFPLYSFTPEGDTSLIPLSPTAPRAFPLFTTSLDSPGEMNWDCCGYMNYFKAREHTHALTAVVSRKACISVTLSFLQAVLRHFKYTTFVHCIKVKFDNYLLL